MTQPRTFLHGDWYAAGIPRNVQMHSSVYLDSSYAFVAYQSQRDPGLCLGEGTGVYDRATFIVGPQGKIDVGSFTCLNGTYVICHASEGFWTWLVQTIGSEL